MGKRKKQKRDGEFVWPEDVEAALVQDIRAQPVSKKTQESSGCRRSVGARIPAFLIPIQVGLVVSQTENIFLMCWPWLYCCFPPVIEPRKPSERSTRVHHPGAPDAPRAKRTHEDVEEEKALKAVVIADRERRRIEAIAMVAAIDAEQDAAAEAEEDNAIFTLDDLHEDAMDVDRTGDTADEDAPFLEFTQQDFERVEDDDVYRSPDEFEKLKAKPLAVKKVKKVKVLKGDTRKEVEVATKLLAESKMAKGLAIAVKKKGVQNSNAAAASTKAGVSSRWRASKAAEQVTPPGSPKLGGLTDEDAEARRPESGAQLEVPQRINEFIRIDDSSDPEDTPSKPPVKAQLSLALQELGWKETRSIRHAAKTPKKTPKPKATVRSEASSDSSVFTPDGAADVKGLPAFIGPTWDSHFLPALYAAFDCSLDPLMVGAKVDFESAGLLSEESLSPLSINSFRPLNSKGIR
ncbi:hypothetical protein B0H10DRAFT_2199871 [Mycena sp. CBHHK59/15]|nr:hypothetical protein B0H10DRAFT_2199871 [Mycena sp. CBHHK59/15]